MLSWCTVLLVYNRDGCSHGVQCFLCITGMEMLSTVCISVWHLSSLLAELCCLCISTERVPHEACGHELPVAMNTMEHNIFQCLS